ncbi:MAG: hypothetical protein ABIJ86_05300, partial [Spirochaetota bacterium]
YQAYTEISSPTDLPALSPVRSWVEYRDQTLPRGHSASAVANIDGTEFFYLLGGSMKRNYPDADGRNVFINRLLTETAYGSVVPDQMPTIASSTALTARRAYAAAAALDGKLYVLGGYSDIDSNSSFRTWVDEATVSANGIDQWTRRDDLALPMGTSGLAAVAYEGRLYIAGGDDGGEAFHTVYSWSSAEGSWRAETAMEKGRSYFGLVARNGYLYALGGRESNSGNCQSSIERCPVGSGGVLGPWEMIRSLPFDPDDPTGDIQGGLGEFGTCIWSSNGMDYLVVAGGVRNGKIAGELWLTPIQTNGDLGEFIRGADILPARRGSTALAVNATLLIAGGESGWMGYTEYSWDDILSPGP